MPTGMGQNVEPPRFNISAGFADWLAAVHGSIIFTARRLGKVFCIGLNEAGQVSFFERSFPDPSGLAVHNGALLMADRFRVWRFENALQPETNHPYPGFDAVYLPEVMYRTGLHDTHDVGMLSNGTPVFASTRLNCVAACSTTHGAAAYWQPPFILENTYEDRCHLNGFALEEGALRYVTALAETNEKEGWRKVRRDGGIIVSPESGQTIISGLSMPHSPRLCGGELWVINSGTGEIGRVDLEAGSFSAVANVQGFARGLVFVGDHAITATSRLRQSTSFQNLPLQDTLEESGDGDVCGLHVFHRESGGIAHSLILENDTIEEIYDVAFVPGVRRIMLGGLNDDLSEQFVTMRLVTTGKMGK